MEEIALFIELADIPLSFKKRIYDLILPNVTFFIDLILSLVS